MKKMNNKGFALVETLIVATFVMGILTLIFSNFLPMMGKYERRERYDDIDSVYNTYLIKRMLENGESKDKTNTLTSKITSNPSPFYNPVNCNIYNNTEFLDYCQNIFQNTGVSDIIVTSYNLSSLKNNLPTNSSKDFKDYISSLPNYNKNKENYKYRIIVRYKHIINSETGDENTYYSFSTIGVDL